MGKQTDTIKQVWIVTPEDTEHGDWLKGFALYAQGASDLACTNHAQRTGFFDAIKADAACQVIDTMAANGGDASDFDAFLHGIESDHEWIRTGC